MEKVNTSIIKTLYGKWRRKVHDYQYLTIWLAISTRPRLIIKILESMGLGVLLQS